MKTYATHHDKNGNYSSTPICVQAISKREAIEKLGVPAKYVYLKQTY